MKKLFYKIGYFFFKIFHKKDCEMINGMLDYLDSLERK